jgi:hypothetical protein
LCSRLNANISERKSGTQNRGNPPGGKAMWLCDDPVSGRRPEVGFKLSACADRLKAL